jgi:hypothetical protein
VLDDGEELREAPRHFGYLVVRYDSAAVTPITPRMRKASQRDGRDPRRCSSLVIAAPFQFGGAGSTKAPVPTSPTSVSADEVIHVVDPDRAD